MPQPIDDRYPWPLQMTAVERAEELARVLARAAEVDGCLIWQGALNRGGYPQLCRSLGPRRQELHKTMWRVHRYVFLLAKGEVPDGLDLDHLCRNRSCVNPEHLEAVSNQENVARGFRSRRVA